MGCRAGVLSRCGSSVRLDYPCGNRPLRGDADVRKPLQERLAGGDWKRRVCIYIYYCHIEVYRGDAFEESQAVPVLKENGGNK